MRILRGSTAVLALAAVLVLPGRAAAEPVALTVISDISLQQTYNHPCVIGDPSCSNPTGFDFTLIPSGHADATLSSPTYTVAQLRELLGGDDFDVGLDLNQAPGRDDGAYNLIRFTLAVNGTIFFSTMAPMGVLPVNPGNGFSDAEIRGFSLAGLAPTDRLVFTTTYSGDSGGREQYFLHAAAAEGGGELIPNPEPASMILLGTGLVGAFAARRRKQV